MMKVKFVLFGVILFVVSLTCAVPSFAEPVERVERAVVNTTSGVHVSVRKTLSRKESRALRRMLDEAESVVKMARAAADRAARIPDLEKRIREMEKTCGQLSTVRDELRAEVEKAKAHESKTLRKLVFVLHGELERIINQLNRGLRGLYKNLYAQRVRVEIATAFFLDAGMNVDLKQISALGLNFLWHRDNWAIRVGFSVGSNTLEKTLGWSVHSSFERKWGMFSMGPILLLNVDSGKIRQLKGTQMYVGGGGLSMRLSRGKYSAYMAPYLGLGGSKAEKHGRKAEACLSGGFVFGTGIHF